MPLQPNKLHDALLPIKEGREISVPALFRRVRASGATRQGLHKQRKAREMFIALSFKGFWLTGFEVYTG